MQCTHSKNFTLYLHKVCVQATSGYTYVRTRTGSLKLYVHKVRVMKPQVCVHEIVRKVHAQEISQYSYAKDAQGTSRYSYIQYAYRKPHVICTQGTRTRNLIRTQGTRSGRLTLYVHKVCIDETHVIHTQSTRTGSFMFFVH